VRFLRRPQPDTMGNHGCGKEHEDEADAPQTL
jgi:hypothetical protein